MASLDELIQRFSRFDSAIENALNDEVAQAVKDAVAESARLYVYDVYQPAFRSRRGDPDGDYYGRTAGGITDPHSIKVEVHGNELIATDDVKWQRLWGGAIPIGRLADAIASGDSRYHMQRAGARPFHEKAKQRIISEGIAEDALRRGLQRQGYDTSELTFKFY